MPTRSLLGALVLVLLGACTPATESKSESKANAESKAKRSRDAPIPCETDPDCPPIACGPCKPGTVLTDANSGFDCKVDPCRPGGAVCGADKVCVVRPDAKASPPRDDGNAK